MHLLSAIYYESVFLFPSDRIKWNGIGQMGNISGDVAVIHPEVMVDSTDDNMEQDNVRWFESVII